MSESSLIEQRDRVWTLFKGAGLSSRAADQGAFYWLLVSEENQRQNLTRLLEPQQFFSGHVLDVLELRRMRDAAPQGISETWIDLGSGCGVPGLLSAVLFEDERWILVEAEVRKAEFLARAARELGVEKRVEVKHARIESVCKGLKAGVIVSKAVGTATKVYGWVKDCSTWNSLVFFKGPKWEEEWREFQSSSARKNLKVSGEHRYSTPEGANRLIIQLDRVPRETTPNQKKS